MNLLQPTILALLVVDAISLALLLPSLIFAIQILRHWNPDSGSAQQIRLERQTHLIATLIGWVLLVQILSLVLFVHTAEQLAEQMVGAMCAIGTLSVNPWGFPALLLRMTLFFVATTWLLLHHFDFRAPDYPLIRFKYGLLLLLVPLAGVTAWMQWRYFQGIQPDVIASCCGSFFHADQTTLPSQLAALPAQPTLIGYFSSLALTLSLGLIYLIWRRGLGLFAGATVLVFPVALIGIISFLSLYVYEHPWRHSPFGILEAEFGYIGYALYAPLFLATALGLGLGCTALWQRFAASHSLRLVLHQHAPALAGVAWLALMAFTLLSGVIIWRSNLILIGY